MLPSPTDIASAAQEVAMRGGEPITLRENAIRLALREAEHLTHDHVDVPAALHFTFTRHRDVFSRDTPQVLAKVIEDAGLRLGIKVLVRDAELLARLAVIPSSVEDAFAWFSGKVVLYGG